MSTVEQENPSQHEIPQEEQEKKEEKEVWTPIECDPDVLQDVVGLYGVNDTIITEVYGEELFDMVPQPIEALILLFPSGFQPIQDYLDTTFPVDKSKKDIFHIPQRVSNACGTYALIHTFMNLRNGDEFKEDSPFSKLWFELVSNPNATPDEKWNFFLQNKEEISKLHHQFSVKGQTNADNYTDTDVHYVSIFQKHGSLWILDGHKDGPLNCGSCADDEVLNKSYQIAKEIYRLWGKEGDLAMLAATRMPSDE